MKTTTEQPIFDRFKKSFKEIFKAYFEDTLGGWLHLMIFLLSAVVVLILNPYSGSWISFILLSFPLFFISGWILRLVDRKDNFMLFNRFHEYKLTYLSINLNR